MARQLIKYAGFDPNENDFTGLEFPELRPFPLGALARKDRIDVEEALRLREEGMKYKDIGILMAQVRGRPMPYCHDSIINACYRARKKRANV